MSDHVGHIRQLLHTRPLDVDAVEEALLAACTEGGFGVLAMICKALLKEIKALYQEHGLLPQEHRQPQPGKRYQVCISSGEGWGGHFVAMIMEDSSDFSPDNERMLEVFAISSHNRFRTTDMVEWVDGRWVHVRDDEEVDAEESS